MAFDDVPLTPVAPRSAPPQVIIQQPPSMFGRFGKWLLAALVLAVFFIMGIYGKYQSYFTPPNAPVERFHSLSRTAMNKLAIIDVSGAIMEGEDSFAKRQIDRVKADSSVVGVIVRINSPGGTVTGSDYIYHHLRQLQTARSKNGEKFPVVVSMGSICASGGYYVAMAVGDQQNVIFAEPTTWTGSIGVIIPHYDLTGTLSKLGAADDSIVSAPLKQMGSPTKPMTPEERKVLQTLVDESFKGFKEIVTNGRPKFKNDQAALDAATTGQIFTAQQALDRGLVDKIGFIEEAIARTAELAGYSTDNLRCVRYEQPPSLMQMLAGANASLRPSTQLDVRALIDLTTPRAYYLWSWLPAAMSNTQ